MDDETLERVENFKYLRSVLREIGGMDTELSE